MSELDKLNQELKQLKVKHSQAMQRSMVEVEMFKKGIYELLESQKMALLTLQQESAENKRLVEQQKRENTQLQKKLSNANERYERLNNSKLVKISRKYWAFNQKTVSKGAAK
ncbi:hypothetical protein HB943_01155 [Listeria weihenstephanensis]|uniref:Uncharacterized protein n=1 Tax=Listeria weihenstephanensis TaxID=1006155 RepID=A0A841Z1S2_9LIST|nr:hypothetical protein [Listeria weihenstephanensis]MBC1499190.1 hypothetical protein [Listeria weihenstephanensis]